MTSELPPEIKIQAEFAAKKGRNVSDRLVPELLKAIGKKLDGQTIELEGRSVELRVLSDLDNLSKNRLIFDVKKPIKGFSHVEFTIEKSGWEMCLMEE